MSFTRQIRDLEARVEILSGSKDETYVQMRDIIRGECDMRPFLQN